MLGVVLKAEDFYTFALDDLIAMVAFVRVIDFKLFGIADVAIDVPHMVQAFLFREIVAAKGAIVMMLVVVPVH